MRPPSRAPLKARAALVLAAAIMGLSLTAVPANASCGVPKIWLVGFPLGDQLPRFYWGTEGGSAGIYARAADFCPRDDLPHEGSTRWALSAGSASLDEVSPDSGTFNFEGNPNDHTQPVDDFAFVNLAADADELTEDVTVSLTSPTQGSLVQPTQAPLHIVDSGGSARVATVPTTSTPAISENENFKFPVFKAGAGTANVTVTVSGGTPGSDYTQPAPVSFSASERFKIVTIDILLDNTDTGTETYTATITDGGGAGIGTTDSMQFTVSDIQSDDDPPLTSFHHPKNGVTYKFGSAKARTVHVYAPGPSVEPSGIVDSSVKTAVKRTMKSGSCKWWNGSGWVNDGCADSNRNDHWLKTEFLYIFNGKRLYEHFLKQNLPPSVGTKTKFFHAYSTAQDGAGNVDDQIDLGRNKNKFEIKKF